jgi:hypothetical protein
MRRIDRCATPSFRSRRTRRSSIPGQRSSGPGLTLWDSFGRKSRRESTTRYSIGVTGARLRRSIPQKRTNAGRRSCAISPFLDPTSRPFPSRQTSPCRTVRLPRTLRCSGGRRRKSNSCLAGRHTSPSACTARRQFPTRSPKESSPHPRFLPRLRTSGRRRQRNNVYQNIPRRHVGTFRRIPCLDEVPDYVCSTDENCLPRTFQVSRRRKTASIGESQKGPGPMSGGWVFSLGLSVETASRIS